MTAFQNGDYVLAETKLRNVKAGPDLDAAKQRLAEIPGLKQKALDAANAASANAATESTMKARFDQGMAYFSGNDYPNAEKTLTQVTAGAHQGEAQATVNRIRSYNAKMNEAQQAVASRNFAGAVTAYGAAIAIVPNGPGNPQGAMADAVRMASTAAQPVTQPSNTSAAVKPTNPARPTIDIAAYLDSGKKALAKNDFKKARRFFTEVLVQDRNNQEAKDALAELNSKDTAQAKASDEDTLLLDIVKTYYAGSYQDAEDRLKVYIYNNQGKKKGLANFYLGASMLTRYYLSGGNDDTLRREAKNKFKAAKDVEGFKPPDKLVSPKIMKVFEEAS
jgi:Tfp pilus assembly protein PilF